MKAELKDLVRPNIWALKPYSCARDEFKGMPASVFLDANESPYNGPINRYPDPLQEQLKARLAELKDVPAGSIFLGNGSDEAIDLVYRVFCRPRVDNVVAIEPTYGMYRVAADINDVEYRPVLLDEHFQLSADRLLAAADEHTKVIWICSPNNPTGNDMLRDEMVKVIQTFPGIVVVDEAYSDFSQQEPLRFYAAQQPNLIVLNTLSKAWASAGARLGMAFANADIIRLFNKVKYPYNVNSLTQEYALKLLAEPEKVERWVAQIKRERLHLLPALAELPLCQQLYPTAANFVLIRVSDADRIYRYLVERGIVVRNRSRVELCGNCLRITIGTPQENNTLLGALRQFKP